MKPTNEELIEEYNTWFKTDGTKWAGKAGQSRDMFAIGTMSKYLPPRSIADIGCGNGHSLEAFHSVYPSADLYAIDLSIEALERVRELLPEATLIEGFIEELQLSDPFDWVLCLGTAEHFRDLPLGLKTLRSITSQICYLEIPHNLLYSPGIEGFRRLKTRSRQHEWHLTREIWELEIQDAGFDIVESLTGLNEAWEFVWVLK